jgi:hypothetical protein
MMHFEKLIVKASKGGILGPVWLFSWIYCVWYLPWFLYSESTSSFLLALKSCNPPAGSAIFPVTVTTFYKEG